MENALIDTMQAAKLLGVSKSLLDHDRLRPVLGVPYIKLGTVVRYDPQALLAWARARMVNPPAPWTAVHAAQPEPQRRKGRARKAV